MAVQEGGTWIEHKAGSLNHHLEEGNAILRENHESAVHVHLAAHVDHGLHGMRIGGTLVRQVGTNGLSGQAAADFYINNFSSIEPEFSDATVRLITANGGTGVQKVVNGLPGGDQGFHNIGASVTANDRGRAASPGGAYYVSDFNEGAFKTPGLRNVRLTAPFMHNGSLATIPDVIDFYNGRNQLATNLGVNPAANVGLGGDRNSAADFLLNGLTDCRVEHELAPFDHPSLVIPNGPTLPAVGSAGNGTICP